MLLAWLYLFRIDCGGFESQRHPFSALPKTARGEFPSVRAVSISEKRLNVAVCIPIRVRDYDMRPCAVWSSFLCKLQLRVCWARLQVSLHFALKRERAGNRMIHHDGALTELY